MSYCRFSSDNWKSDIYCYEHCQGYYQIHIAKKRIKGTIPPLQFEDNIIFLDSYRKQRKALDRAKREEIKLPHAGEDFSFLTPAETVNFLKELRKIGYHMPEHAIKALEEEVIS